MNDNLIYGLYCPVTNNIVYIGKTTTGLNRPFQHISEKSHSKKVNEWINDLKKDGLSPTIVVLEYADNPNILNAKERFWIQYELNKGNILLNQTLVSPSFFKSNRYSANSDNPIIDICVYVKAKRNRIGLTQKELADKAGVGLRFIRELESGKKTNFNTGCIIQVLNLFGGKLTVS